MMNEQVNDFHKSVVDAAVSFARMSVESAERLIALNLEATRTCLDETGRNMKAFSTVSDGQELNTVRTKIAESSLETAADYSRKAYEVVVNAQAEATRLVEQRVSEWQAGVADGLEKVVSAAPAGNDVVTAALKSNITAANAAWDGMNKAFKQAASLNGRHLESVSGAVPKKALASSKKRK